VKTCHSWFLVHDPPTFWHAVDEVHRTHRVSKSDGSFLILNNAVKNNGFLAYPLSRSLFGEGLRFAVVLYILVIFVRPIISTSTGSIFTKFAGLVDL